MRCSRLCNKFRSYKDTSEFLRIQLRPTACEAPSANQAATRAGLGVVTVASSDEMAEKTMRSVVDEIERLEPGLITRSQVEYLR